MNALQVNKETGFLESEGPSNATFTSDKKLNFIAAAEKYRREGKFPRVSDICDAVGIDARTFERHIELDEKFKERWREVSTRIEYDCISDMSDLRKKNPMYMFGLLRYLNPSRWNPNQSQSNVTNNVSIFVDNLKDIKPGVEAQAITSSALKDASIIEGKLDDRPSPTENMQ